MKVRFHILALLLCLFALAPVLAQQQPPKPATPVPASGEKPLIYEDTLASDKRKSKVKKIPKKTFYGIKTRKAFTKVKSGRKLTYELFYILKKPLEPDPYVRDIYWFHRKKRKVFVGAIPPKEKAYAVIMHGPYEKIVNKITVEQGQFYVGVKHGRWETNTTTEEELLLDKKKWNKGWPKEATISYYDPNKTKIQEVIPIEAGVKHGEYFKFYPGGQMQVNGKYEHGRQIGVWREFYVDKKRLKLETQYPPDGFTEQEPYKIREFNEKGLVVYDKATEDKKKK